MVLLTPRLGFCHLARRLGFEGCLAVGMFLCWLHVLILLLLIEWVGLHALLL